MALKNQLKRKMKKQKKSKSEAVKTRKLKAQQANEDKFKQLFVSAILFSAEIEDEHECLYKGDNDEKIDREDQIYESSPFACVFCLTHFDSELELENHIGSHSAITYYPEPMLLSKT